jgi:hypothetical protein
MVAADEGNRKGSSFILDTSYQSRNLDSEDGKVSFLLKRWISTSWLYSNVYRHHIISISPVPRSTKRMEGRIVKIPDTGPSFRDYVLCAGDDCRVFGHIAP